ncbi:diguanylate cyclase YdeH [mine drainage metagenome]|jgi:diguanylate cyclase (GGDEF)-like protein|uniref:Diguanylate cyclase YdeH n=1 Tax=mine drainage metagenome TaxID=410659 RepID=A0A1J5RKA8_9ZZZZ
MEPVFAATTTAFIERLDAAIGAHMDWTRHILRCAVLRTRPGDDVMQADAHRRCAFGRWFADERAAFALLDPQRSAEVEREHRAMHDAIRRICEAVDTVQGGSESDLDAFETHQHALLRLLSELKTQVLTTAARRDPLTGLPMRYGIEQEFDLCRRDARRRGEGLYAVMIDIDHFKQINDRHGHPTGDAVLQRFAAVLRAATRDDEPLYRFGGEEFLLLLRAPDVDAARAALSRVLDAVRSARFEHGAASLSITATIGAAEVTDGADMASSVEAADAALYQGKREGRDRVRLVLR